MCLTKQHLSYAHSSQRPILVAPLTTTTSPPHTTKLMPTRPIIVISELLIRLTPRIKQRSFSRITLARNNAPILLLLFPHPHNHTPSDQHSSPKPPQPRQALPKNQRRYDRRDEEIRTRVDNTNPHGAARKRERAREQAPHDGVEKQVQAEEDRAKEVLEYMT